MNGNTLRIQIVKDILNADVELLHQLHALCRSTRRKTIVESIIDPEWISITDAAEQLDRHPAHIRRLAAREFPLFIEMRRDRFNQLAMHLRRSSLPDLTRATMRRRRATQEGKKVRITKNAHLYRNSQDSDNNTESLGTAERFPIPSK